MSQLNHPGPDAEMGNAEHLCKLLPDLLIHLSEMAISGNGLTQRDYSVVGI